uniref:Uncharacterized protein n=1 Tax=Araucaria cunninghamii TaxID=56994 RepID=A0A0D6R8Q9_ARACU
MGRSPCCDKVGVKKGPWTPEEDIVLVSYIQEHGPGNWRMVPAHTGLMSCSKSCRLRWTNYLRPGIKRGNFTPHEDRIIVHLQALLGNRWAAIASYLPQRTDNDIKNYWNTHLKKRLKKLQTPFGSNELTRDSTKRSSDLSVNAGSSKGQWESKLQTDIHRAKQELYEALNMGSSPDLQASSGCISTPCINSSSYYAASIENFTKLLEGWKRSSANSNDMKALPSMQNSGSATPSSSDSQSSHHISSDSQMEGLNSMDNGSLAWTSQFDSYGDDQHHHVQASQSNGFQNTTVDNGLPFSGLENWLMEESNQDQLNYMNTQAVYDLGCF